MPAIYAITGGIGSGKSLVCKVLRSLGYDVFDCDTEAKRLMDTDANIKSRLATEIDVEVIENNEINRRILADIVFNNPDKLRILNSIVHGAVRNEILRWVNSCDARVVFVETAILYSSGLDSIVDGEIRVTASEEVRVHRVMKRNGLSEEHIKARIRSQFKEMNPDKTVPDIYFIDNTGNKPVLPQLFNILSDITG